jgi:hypothetical protein
MSSPLAPAGTTRIHADTRPAVTALSDFWSTATVAVARTPLADER